MSKNTNTLHITTRDDWRKWLVKNHKKANEIWLIYFKKHTGKPRIPYEDAVEEALCFGWIDTTVKRIDDQTFMQKFTPRKKNSMWSKLNKQRAGKMIRAGKMERAGYEKIEEAKNNGKWDEAYAIRDDIDMPEDLSKALQKNVKAYENFMNFAPSYRRDYIRWITSAKRSETIERRIKIVIERAEKNIKPGMI